jgi:hypothetical protein
VPALISNIAFLETSSSLGNSANFSLAFTFGNDIFCFSRSSSFANSFISCSLFSSFIISSKSEVSSFSVLY